MDAGTFAWVLARVTGLAAFAALSVSLLSGTVLRTAVLDWLAGNRALRSLHEFTAILWMPLGGLHMVALLLDPTARIGVADLVVPFRAGLGDPRATLAYGLGTLTFEILLLVAATGWLRRRMSAGAWRWTHRLAYVAFALLFLHAVLGGSDFSDPAVAALTWATATMLATLAFARILWGRLPA